MSDLTEQKFVRYLAAKKTVDDRALNRSVWNSLKREIRNRPSQGPLKVLEIGAGIGTMVERALEWELFCRAEYLALDAMEENITAASSRVPLIAESLGYSVTSGRNGFRFEKEGAEVTLSLTATDVFDFVDQVRDQDRWDLLVANAFLDLVDVPSALPLLLSLLRPDGLFYFTITFDGATILEPEVDRELDARIEFLYHQTMDRRTIRGKPSGDSRTGRHFFGHIKRLGARLLEAGSSDWVVFAGPDGYRADEKFFLHFIVDTIASAVGETREVDPVALRAWAEARHGQIDAGELVYVAHQMDFLGRTSQ
jgi:SAM-dependent methyltransferase